MDLAPAELEDLSKAILDAFRSVEQLRQMVFFKTGNRIDEFTVGALQDRVFQLISESEAAGWTKALIEGAIATRPQNPLLARFAVRYRGSIQRQVSGPMLEKLIVRTNSFLMPVQWRTRLAQIEHQVCRIEIDGIPAGTGFLVGPNLILSAFHVMQDVIDGKFHPAQVGLRFDHKHAADGVSVESGNVFSLSNDWLVASSPPSPIDLEPDPKSGEPLDNELDFVLLRVEGNPGGEEVGAEPRSWITVPETNPDFQSDPAMMIVQHPEAKALQLAIDTNAFLSITSNRTRVRYKTNTMPGSSGSPCFNFAWRLIAVHHSGDPAFRAKYNEGIPIDSIRRHIAAHLESLG